MTDVLIKRGNLDKEAPTQGECHVKMKADISDDSTSKEPFKAKCGHFSERVVKRCLESRDKGI